jgi:hypothetical protein
MESLIEQVAVCDDPIKDEESTTYTVNKIGGIPVGLKNFSNVWFFYSWPSTPFFNLILEKKP